MGLFRITDIKTIPIPNYGKFVVRPTMNQLYVDTDGTSCDVSSDVILRQRYKWTRSDYSIIIPGLVEWLERYRHAVDKETYAVDPEFDWRIWHIDGLLFTKEIYSNLPRNIPVRYEKPPGDHSRLVENFDVQSEEQIDQLLVQLGDMPEGRKPESIDNIVVGVKSEDEGICMRFKIKGKFDSFVFEIGFDSISLLKDFLERISLSEGKNVEWESRSTENGMYLYPQTIGGYKHIYRLHIFSEKELAFSAYINSREFVRAIYKSIMTNLGTLNDKDLYNDIQSTIVECFIDDRKYEKISFIRRFPKLANTIGPLVENVRKYFQEIYDSILEDTEYV